MYDIGVTGASLGQEVVTAVRTFAGSIVQDVDAVLRDPAPSDGVDVLAFIDAVRPLSATPMSGVGSIDLMNLIGRFATGAPTSNQPPPRQQHAPQDLGAGP